MDDHLPSVAAGNPRNTVLLGARHFSVGDGNPSRMMPSLNHGRWVVNCPSIDCAAAVLVLPWQMLAVCDCRDRDFCQHGRLCGTLIQIDWPADWQQIEQTVRGRPITNRNWMPGESLTRLLEENMAHGVDNS